ncbi:hypothetical protein HFX_0835 [Haloferax mediterranei ATCC 33500]|uniref:Uncharacterized protein n=2 Tax=Haloferax mediterranei (strain ATCC 33500 / DSM 1411 / JCM 8866 / NBRC 14739 / NCIMB 2177 / R-4) TaxID=523841 RepID=I3R2U6_HALMT|nr:hypothetical protein HFX_0835 [Haloferax mediterranei ATCC 33500]
MDLLTDLRMTDIEIRNENGQLVGYDKETGEEVPISFKETETDVQHVDQATVNGSLSVVPDELNNWDGGKRPLVTSKNTRVYVDPEDGDDDAAGTESDPIETIQEAFFRQPYIINHLYEIILKPGVYTSRRADQPPTISSAKPANPALILRGETGDRSDVIVESELSLAYLHGEQDVATVKDLTTDHTIIQKFGNIKIRNVHFRGAGEPLTTPNGPVGFNAHGPTETTITECTFSDNYAEGARVTEESMLKLNSLSGHPTHYGVVARSNAEIVLRGDLHQFWGKKGQWSADMGARVRRGNGKTVHNNPVLYDDFGDGSLVEVPADNRLKSSGHYLHRPDWVTNRDDVVVSGGELILPDGSSVLQGPRVTRGRYIYDFNFESIPSGNMLFRPVYYSSGEQVAIAINSNVIENWVVQGGNINTTISSSWSADTDSHRIELRRDDDGHELIFDGETIGVDSKTHHPPADKRSGLLYQLENRSGSQINIEQVWIIQDN